ncbi:MAG: L-2-hydroxyglutarate oxidase [Myxococcota bacterium]|nr:L-2-hydroxyglutarate oxidase [Myxococcota bacterium]
MSGAGIDLLVIGAGIVGLTTARAWLARFPGAAVHIVDKEETAASHQTGRNSGVIHSGVYYQPGSLKAQTTTRGRRALIEFCVEHQIAHELCGKVIVATSEDELGRLDSIWERGRSNDVRCELLSRDALKELEPACAGMRAIRVYDAGIVDYRGVCEAILRELQTQGVEVHLGTEIVRCIPADEDVALQTADGEMRAKHVINCAGLYSDRVAMESGAQVGARIIPFRGEYFDLVESAQGLCRNLIYPVPDPEFPFLGVHLTRMVDGGVEVGPNAVLAFAREGYRKRDVDLRELWWTLSYRGFWALAAEHWQAGCVELWRSMSKKAFTRSLQRLVPELTEADLVEAEAGVRAQAVLSTGALVDDFVVARQGSLTHVVNAPSPAATAAFALADLIVQRALDG